MSLEAKQGTVWFDPTETSAETVRQEVEDMGFDAAIASTSSSGSFLSNDSSYKSSRSTSMEIHGEDCRLTVEGMTCNSCVKTIENNLGVKEGIRSIKVV